MENSDFATGSVRSQDGTEIGYWKIGHGPSLVLIQGAMGTAANYAELARILAPHFTVYLPDRRGRGMSPRPYSPQHDIARDVEDVEAVRAAGEAQNLFGLSSGAMITLEATRRLPGIARAAVYEPPFYPGGFPHAKVKTFAREVERGDLASALVTVGQIVKLMPWPVRVMPKAVLRLLTGAVLRRDARTSGPYTPMAELIPAIRYDFNVVGGMDGKLETFRSLNKPMLLLSGTRSPAYLHQSIRRLATLLPDAKHVEFKGLDHSGSWNVDRGGQPMPVAEALRTFFS